MMQSYHIHGDRNLRIHSEQKFRDDAIPPHSWGPSLWIHFEQNFKDDAIPPHSRGLKPLDTFWTEVQEWCNPTTLTGTEASGYILNRCSGMMQSHHTHGDRRLWIHFEQKFRDDAIPPHCYGEKFLWLGVPQQTARLQKSIFPDMQ